MARRFGGPAVVVAVVLLANLPGLIGLVHPDPLLFSAADTPHLDHLLPGTWYTDQNTGLTAQALGHRAALDWLRGHVPWWNPFEGIGSPLAAEMQSAALFPPVLLFALANGALYFHVLLEVVAGLGTWFLVREIGLSRFVATVGGVLFGLNGTFAWTPHAPMNPVALLPLLLLGVERLYRQPDRDSGWIILALALALSLYAGFPETAYLDGLLALAWAALRLVQARGRKRVALGRWLALGGCVGILLALPLAVPMAEYLPHACLGFNASGRFVRIHLRPLSLAELGLPYVYGPVTAYDRSAHLGWYWEMAGGFAAPSTLVLAVVGLFGARREKGLRYLLGGVTVGLLAWVFGLVPFVWLSRIVPFMGHVFVGRFSSPVWEMALILLACFGLDAAGRDMRARRAALGGGIVVCGLLVVMLVGPVGRFATTVAGVHPNERSYELATVLWSFTFVIAAAALGLIRRRRWSVAALSGIMLVDAFVLAGIPQMSAPLHAQVDLGPVSYLRRHLGTGGRYFTFGPLAPNYGSYFGIGQVNDADLPVPRRWASEIVNHLAPNSNPVSFNGVKVVHRYGTTPLAQALDHLPAYEALDVRYFVVRNDAGTLPPVGPYPHGLKRVFHDGYASIFALPDPKPFFHTVGGPCAITPRGVDLVTVRCARPATLVRSELDLPGWSATLNGRPVGVASEDSLVTAVKVPAGVSVVAFSFAPPFVNLAVAGFLAGIAVMVGLPLSRRRRRRRRTAATVAEPVQSDDDVGTIADPAEDPVP